MSEKKENIFTEGMIIKEGYFHEGKAHLKVAIKVEDFAQFVKDNADGGWLNLEIKTSQGGKPYSCLDTWKPDADKKPTSKPSKKAPVEDTTDDLPF